MLLVETVIHFKEVFDEYKVQMAFIWIEFVRKNVNIFMHCRMHPSLLDFAVILQLLTVNKSSKIPYIGFTVNYCNTHCIMGIFVLSLQ